MMKRKICILLLVLSCATWAQDAIPSRHKEKGIRVLCLSSSWGVNTWYYLPYMMKEAGIAFQFTGLYVGAATFSTWVDVLSGQYNPHLRQWFFRNDSTAQDYHYSGIQQEGDTLSTDILNTKYDVIITNIGAACSTIKEQWYIQSDEYVAILKNLIQDNGIIVYNSTWSPATEGLTVVNGLHGWVESNRIPSAYGVDGALSQDIFQADNWRNTREWCEHYGIKHIIPNGSLMYLLRQDSLTNPSCFTIPAWGEYPVYKEYCEGDTVWHTQDGINYSTRIGKYDLCIDGLHAATGLPSFALALNAFATVFSPLYNIPISEISWRPTSIRTRAQSAEGEAYLPSFHTEGWIPYTTSFEIALSSQQTERILELIPIAQAHPFHFVQLSPHRQGADKRNMRMSQGNIYIYDSVSTRFYNMKGEPISLDK